MKRISIGKMIELYHALDGCHSRVAKEIGCTREYVRQKLTPMGYPAKGKAVGYIPPKGPRKYTEAYMRDLYARGEGRYFKMAEIEGVSSTVIVSSLKRLGLHDELKSQTNLGRPRKEAA